MESELVISTTTDSQAIAQAAAEGNELGARVPAPEPEVEQLDGSMTVSYEHPRSERRMLEERLAQHESDLKSLSSSESEQVSSTEPVSDESGAEQEETAPDDIDLDEIRRTATADAIATARARQVYADEEQAAHLSQPAEDPLRAQVNLRFNEQLESLGADLTALRTSDVVIPRCVGDLLLTSSGGPAAALYLANHPQEARALAEMPEQAAIASAARLTARFDSHGSQRPLSRAPSPISPVRGSATRSTVPLDEMPYSEYRAIRDKQEKAHYRR